MKSFILFCLLLTSTATFAMSCPEPTPAEIKVRVQQGISNIFERFVFEENNSRTWATINLAVKNYLTSVWLEGYLSGETAEKAFSVSIGLGSTMTNEDVVNGIERLNVNAAIDGYQKYTVFNFVQKIER